jgi:hypothetical protein
MSNIEELLEGALAGALAAQGGFMTSNRGIYMGSGGTVNIQLLASVLVAGLGLTEEWAIQDGLGGEPMLRGGRNTARFLAANGHLGPETTAVCRFVSHWGADE